MPHLTTRVALPFVLLAFGCKSSGSNVASDDSAPPPSVFMRPVLKTLTTGPSSESVARKVPLANIRYVVVPGKPLSDTSHNLQGLQYCRPVVPNADGKFRGLSSGPVLMSTANARKVDDKTIRFPVLNDGNYAYKPRAIVKDFANSTDPTQEEYNLVFADDTHAHLEVWTRKIGQPLDQLKSTENGSHEWTMEWIASDDTFGPHWLRHSHQLDSATGKMVNQGDYRLLPVVDADGTPTLNWNTFLDDMKNAGVSSFDVAVSKDSDLAQPGSQFPTAPTIRPDSVWVSGTN